MIQVCSAESTYLARANALWSCMAMSERVEEESRAQVEVSPSARLRARRSIDHQSRVSRSSKPTRGDKGCRKKNALATVVLVSVVDDFELYAMTLRFLELLQTL